MSVQDGGPLSDQLQWVGLGSHAKLERQGSKGSRGCPTPSRQVATPLGNRVDSEKQSDDLHGLLSIVSRDVNTRMFATFNSCINSMESLISWLVILQKMLLNYVPSHQDSGFQSWGEEPKWRAGTEENHHTPFAERSRKQDKGGFRSSFKKLFKKK